MSETEEDRRYYQAAEAAFIRRRGTPFLLSPRDFALLKQWRALAVPIEAVEQGIDDAFSRREERAARGRVNSLSYCAGAVLEAWERRAEMSVGRGGARSGAEPDVARAIAGLVPESVPAIGQTPEAIAWRDRPSTYVVCTDDRAILRPLQAQNPRRALLSLRELAAGLAALLLR